MTLPPLELEPGHYAVPSITGETMTYWRVGQRPRADLKPWPTNTDYGQRARYWPKDVPTGAALRAAFFEEIRSRALAVWTYTRDAIDGDPQLARARFAAFTTRCGICGRSLTDARSKIEGIGPECRKGFTDEQIAGFARLVAEAHAKAVAS